MNKTLTTILSAAAALVAAGSLCACNDINEDDRFIELPAVEAKRVVLIEEFTGQKCVNCPEAHEKIASLLELYPDNLISVSIHGGSLVYTEDQLPLFGLANAESDAYYTDNNVAAPPAAVVNRTTGVIFSDKWEDAVRKQIERSSTFDLEISEASLSADGKSIQIATTISPWETAQANLQVWVVESGIKSLQLTPEGNKADYVHNNVFRAAVNGHKGDALNLTTREPQTKQYTIDVRDDAKCKWNVDNLTIVAFLYNDSGVLQAAQKRVSRP